MKTKIFTLLLAIVAGVISISGAEVEYDFVENGIYYKKLTETTVAVHYKNYSKSKGYNIAYGSPNTITDAIIPAVVQYSGVQYDVVAISSHAFENCSGLASITCLSTTPPTVGSDAFNGVSTSILIRVPEESLDTYKSANGWSIFTNIFSLSSHIIATGSCGQALTWQINVNGILTISGTGTMDDYDNTIDNQSPWSSYRANIINSIVIEDSVTSIGDYAFYECTGLTSVTIPNSVTSIGDYAFYECTGLTSVSIPNSVTSIGDRAFTWCSGLTSVVWNAKNYADFASNNTPFYDLRSQITSFTFSNEVEHIPAYLCNGMSNLTSIEILNSVTSIGESAFSRCTGLTSITIPSNIASIGEGAFHDCSIYEIHFIGTLEEWINKSWYPSWITYDSENSYYYALYIGDELQTSVTIPNSITSIGDAAFCLCSSLTSITIPNSVTSIGNWAFEECINLTSVTIPNSVTSIGGSAFSGCTWLTDIYVECGDVERIKQLLNNDSRVKYPPVPYTITTYADYGSITTDIDEVTICDFVTCSISPNHGYYFTQWSDGDTSNPRMVQLTQDTSFTAEFAKNTYTITTESSNPKWGTTAGDNSALYLDEVEISATANYGYHFVKWNDNNTSNPRTISVTEDKTYTATFAKNVYIITLNNAEHGSISGDTSAEYLDEVTLTANPEYGYHFAQWSDGNKENTRTFVLTQDTTFNAEFAIDKTGTCGDDNALTWTYDPETKTLTITGNGALNSNYTFGVEAPTQMQKLVIGNEVTAIGDSAFYGMSTINHLIIGGSVATIGNYAFAECRNFDDITCLANVVPVINETTFANVGNKQYIYLFVPAERERAYHRDTYWGEFDIQVQQAEETTVTTNDVTVEPQDNAATVTWPTNDNAASYTIEITKDGVLFCTLTFNANGQLTGIAFAPSHDGHAHAPAAVMTANGLQFTVTGLNSATHYNYTLQTKDANDNILASYSGEFTTTGVATAIDNIDSSSLQGGDRGRLIYRNGQIFILRGDKTYTLQGQEVR